MHSTVLGPSQTDHVESDRDVFVYVGTCLFCQLKATYAVSYVFRKIQRTKKSYPTVRVLRKFGDRRLA
jgi:hypothetical protein